MFHKSITQIDSKNFYILSFLFNCNFLLSSTALFGDLPNQRQGLLSKAISSMWMHSRIIILRTQQSERTHAFMDWHYGRIYTWWCYGTFYGMHQNLLIFDPFILYYLTLTVFTFLLGPKTKGLTTCLLPTVEANCEKTNQTPKIKWSLLWAVPKAYFTAMGNVVHSIRFFNG